MSTSLALLRDRSRRGVRRLALAPRRRRWMALERLEERALLATALMVTNTASTGAGSLEQELTDANAAESSTPTTIDFDIPTTDPGYNPTTGIWTIMVGSGTNTGLPTITVPIVLDGESQTGYVSSPLVVLDGSDVTGSIGDGLVFGQDTAGSSAPSVVEGLSLVNWKFSSQFGGGTAIDIGPGANNPVTVEGNYIGVEPNGTTAAGNDVSGITIQSPQNTIGGTTAADRNIIGGNGINAPSIETGAGIITEDATENTIFGNYIGVSADGHTPVPNSIGVLMSVDTNSSNLGNRLGGTLSGDGNVISGNTEEGVDLNGDEFDVVQGNIIGMNAADTAAVPNGDGGILAHDEAFKDTIGGPATGNSPNTIAGNTGNGVSVGTNTSPPNSAGINIEANSITANTGLGIALGGFSTPLLNDSEGHVGPNALQNFPGITSAIGGNGTITISGTFTEADEPDTTLVADVYADPGDPSDYGQGAFFVGSAQIGPTNGSGVAPTWSFIAVDDIPAADTMLTATATVSNTQASGITVGDTSEFSQDFPLTPTPTPSATQLVVTTAPTPNPVTAGSNFTLTASAEDGSGTVDTTYDQNVTATIMSGPTGAVLGGTTTVAASAGVATFSDLDLDEAGSYTLELSSGTLTSTTTTIDVSPAAATQLAVTEEPTPNPVTAGAAFTVAISAEDQFGNVDTNFTGPITLAIATGPTGSTLGGGGPFDAQGGVVTFNTLRLGTAGTYTLQATSAGLSPATTGSLTVNAGPADFLAVTTQPPSTVGVNGPFSLVISADDGNSNLATSFDGPVALTLDSSSPSGGTLGGTTTVDASNGVATFSNLTLSPAANGYLIDANSGGLDGATTNPIDATTSTAATQLVVTTPPAPNPVTAGSNFSLTVSAEDGSGVVDPTYGQNVTVAILNGPSGGTLSGTTTVTASAGVATFSGLDLDKAGAYTLELTSGTLASTTTSINVNSAAATHLVITFAPAPNPVIAGNRFSLTVAAEDQFGNVDTNYDTNILVAIATGPGSGTLGGTTTVTPDEGAATFANLTLSPAGTYTLQATSGSLTPVTTGQITVNPVTATQLAVTEEPTPNPVTAGSQFAVVISAEDADGNVVTSFTGPITLAIASGPAGGTIGFGGPYDAVDGVVSFGQVVLPKTGTYTLQATSGSLTPATTGQVTVNAGPADFLAVSTQPPSSVVANSPFGLVVAAEDGNSNVATSYDGPVTLTLGAASPSGGTLGGTTTVDASNGLATFSNLTLSPAATGYLIDANSPGLDGAVTNLIDVTAAAATQLVVTTQPPSTVTAGSGFGVAVSVEESSGAIDTGYTGTVALALATGPSGGTLGGTTTATVVNGVATFSNLTLDKAGTGYTIQATSDNLTPALTTPITVVAAAATSLVVTTEPPGTVTVNAPFGTVVSAEDQFGNVASSFTGNVALTLSTNPGSATLGGTTTAAAVGGVAAFSNLTLNVPATGYVLQAGSSGLSSVATSQVAVTAPTTTAPTVTNLQRFGFHAQPTLLVLTFSEPLDSVPAQNVANYTVTGPTGTAIITSAIYNSANNTVTLGFNSRLNVHLTYTITVNGSSAGGLRGTNGLLLDGANNGQPGSNYVMTFGSSILAGNASEAAEAPNMLTLEQIDHGQITDRAVAELVAQGTVGDERHRRHPRH